VRKERYQPLLTQTAEQVAQAGYRGFVAGRRLIVPGIGNKLITFLLRAAPRGLAAAGVEAQQRLRQ
jgi:short-subunit dehydrogenase